MIGLYYGKGLRFLRVINCGFVPV